MGMVGRETRIEGPPEYIPMPSKVGMIRAADVKIPWSAKLYAKAERERQEPLAPAFGAAYIAAKFGGALTYPARHPVEFTKGLASTIIHPVESYKQMKLELKREPIGFLAETAGAVAFFSAARLGIKKAPTPIKRKVSKVKTVAVSEEIIKAEKYSVFDIKGLAEVKSLLLKNQLLSDSKEEERLLQERNLPGQWLHLRQEY